VAILAALVVVGLLILAFFWVAVLASAIAAVAAFNVLAVPRLARRLHVPELVIVGTLLVVLAAGGWLLGGPVAVAGGVVAWVIGVVVPRVILRRYRQNLEVTQRGSATIVDLERSPISAGASDADAVVTYRRPD
jgi:hypothetical protein